MWIYADYLSINRDFVSVFSEEVDRRHPDAWKSFIPHDGLYDMLRKLIVSLERARTMDNKSLWVHGAYGTGKTFASFVIKHLLEDPLPEVESYFRLYTFGHDLFKRLKSLREKGEILVVFRSATSHIDSSRKLLAELQQAIKSALESKGLSSSVTPTVYEEILQKLEGHDSAFDWERAFAKHKSDFADFASPEHVLNQLRSGTSARLPDQISLMDRVAQVMDREGFVVLSSPKDIKSWIREVMQANSLKGIVFIWDEFTDFFINNTGTSALQELAHATSEMPFYLVLVTHRPPETVRAGSSDDWRKLTDRFTLAHYEMVPLTAYQLISTAIRVKDQHHEFWSDKQDRMWDRVRSLKSSLSLDEQRDSDLKDLIPIHPYAAFLAASISRQFSSSQRTLFRFLKEDAKGSFAQFISECPQGEWLWYTADSLWDYFFMDPSLELTGKVHDIVGYFRYRESQCQPNEELRVFKAIMLLMALSHEMPGEQRVIPSLTNVKTLFLGTPLADQILRVVSNLASKELIRRLSAGSSSETYIIPSASIDQNRVDKLKGSYSYRAEVTAKSGSIGKAFCDEYSKLHTVVEFRREQMVAVSVDELEGRRERVEPSIRPYQIGVVMILMQSEEQRDKALRLASELATPEKQSIYIVVEPPFTQNRWDRWCTEKAFEEYYKENRDSTNEQFHRERCQEPIREWLTQTRLSKLQAFFQGEMQTLSGKDGYEKYFPVVVRKVFEYLPESVSGVDTLYRPSYGKTGAAIGLGTATAINNPYKNLTQELATQGFWNKDIGPISDGYSKYPDHPLSQMKSIIDALFDRQDHVSLNDVWDQLQRAPFGLMPSPFGVFIMGYLLRDYCEGFFWTDGMNFFPLSREKMAECINNVIKGSQNVTVYKMTRDAKVFCELVAAIFGLDEKKCEYPTMAKRALRDYVRDRMYPIWSLEYTSGSKVVSPLKSLHYLEEILTSNEQQESVALGPQHLAEIVPHIDREMSSLRQLVQAKGLESGTRIFFDLNEPHLLPLAKELSLGLSSVMSELKALMNEEAWLWKEDAIKERLPELKARFELNLALNELTGYNTDRSLNDAKERLTRRLKESKLPLHVIAASVAPEVGEVIKKLDNFLSSDTGRFTVSDLAKPLTELKPEVREALNDTIGALMRWARTHCAAEISAEEASHLLERLASRSHVPSIAEFRPWLDSELGQMKRQQLGEKLKTRWIDLSLSESPDDWTQKHGMPINWMFEVVEFQEFFSVLRRLKSATEVELTEAIAFIEAHQIELRQLTEEETIIDKFTKIALPRYDGIPIDFLDVEAMRGYILKHAPNVMEWNQDRIAKLCHTWVTNRYQERGYQRILDVLPHLPEKRVKGLLQELAKDPAIGLQLLNQLGSEQREE